jgi:hypothetical protein
MAALLLAHGADTEKVGVRGTALGFALCARRVDMVRLLLRSGAKAEVSVPLFRAKMFETEAPPYRANLLYLALALRPPRHEIYGPELETPSDVGRTELVAMLLKHGARKDVAMNIVSEYLNELADSAEKTEEELLALVEGIFRDADAISAVE